MPLTTSSFLIGSGASQGATLIVPTGLSDACARASAPRPLGPPAPRLSASRLASRAAVKLNWPRARSLRCHPAAAAFGLPALGGDVQNPRSPLSGV